jgi:glycosidase
MTFPGAPCIYYGDEIGMEGGRDPDCRRAFPWDRSHWNESLCDYVKRCVALRHAHPVLRTGTYQSLYAEGDVYVFARKLGTDVAIVGLNAGQEAHTIDFQIPFEGAVSDIHGVWSEKAPQMTDGMIQGWEIGARSGSVLLGRVV